MAIKKVERTNSTKRVSIEFKDKSRTKQSEKKNCEINHILNKWKRTGACTHVQQGELMFGDFAHEIDYHGALNKIIEVDNLFDSLPSMIRKKFKNDPAELIGFLDDDKNYDEAVKLGLVEDTRPPLNPEPVGDYGVKESDSKKNKNQDGSNDA